MFALTDGPTALRSDLVRALSLSVGSIAVEVDGEPRRACAALSGVWNGRKGYVALLIRWLDDPQLQRYAWSEPLTSLEALSEAIEEALGFAEGMGFAMDPVDFSELAPEVQKHRMQAWDEVRKLDRFPSISEDTAPRPRGKKVLARIGVVAMSIDDRDRAGPQARLRAQF
jgi:hypothetical protein